MCLFFISCIVNWAPCLIFIIIWLIIILKYIKTLVRKMPTVVGVLNMQKGKYECFVMHAVVILETLIFYKINHPDASFRMDSGTWIRIFYTFRKNCYIMLIFWETHFSKRHVVCQQKKKKKERKTCWIFYSDIVVFIHSVSILISLHGYVPMPWI